MMKRPQVEQKRCLPGRHTWARRTNPETGEHFEVCERCDAYRDKTQGAPGAVWG